MAPELVDNYIAKTAGMPSSSFNGFACDMWALGVMLIQLLTGKLPFWPKHGFDYQSMQVLLAEWVSMRIFTFVCMCACAPVCACSMRSFVQVRSQVGNPKPKLMLLMPASLQRLPVTRLEFMAAGCNHGQLANAWRALAFAMTECPVDVYAGKSKWPTSKRRAAAVARVIPSSS